MIITTTLVFADARVELIQKCLVGGFVNNVGVSTIQPRVADVSRYVFPLKAKIRVNCNKCSALPSVERTLISSVNTGNGQGTTYRSFSSVSDRSEGMFTPGCGQAGQASAHSPGSVALTPPSL